MLPPLLRSAALVLSLLSLAKANYYIDDSNSTITYTGDWWTGVNETKAFNKTYHASYEAGPWTIDIPFTGSGITLYIVNVYGQNLTVSVDGGTPTNHTVPGPSGERCPIPEFDGYCPVYGVAIYNIQGLYTDKPHTLHVVPDARTLYFDYAVVNDTVLSPTSSAAANHSTSGSSKKTVIGAVIGGAVGGVAVIVAVVFLLLSSRRKKQARNVGEIDPDSKSAIYYDGIVPVATVPNLSPSNVTPAELHTMTPTSLSPPPTMLGTAIGNNKVPAQPLRS